MTETAQRRFLPWIVCLLIAAGLPAALLWAEHHRGGYVPGEVSCPIAFARQTAPAADVIVFGSSRTGQIIDPVFLARTLSQRQSGADAGTVTVERLNSTGPDLVSTIWTLEEYLRNRGRPKLVILETMFRLKPSQTLREQKELFWPRHYSILPFQQIQRFREQYGADSENGQAFTTLSDWSRRITNLLHGLIKDPLGRRWTAAACSVDDLTREREWAWDEVRQVKAPAQAYNDAMAAIQPLIDRRPANPWKWGRKDITEAAFEVDADYRRREVAMMRQIVTTANKAGIPVLLVPLVNFATVVNDRDRDFFLSLGDNTHWYDVYAEIGEPLRSHHLWRDPLHVRKKMSAVISALLAVELDALLRHD